MSYASVVESRLKEAAEKAQAKDFEGALKIYDSILEDNHDNIDALNGKARVLSWMGKYMDARDIYNEALLKAPENIEALIGLGDTYAWQKDYDKAIEILDRALKKNPNEKEILIRLARYNLWSQKKRETIEYADKILRSNPLDEDATGIKKEATNIRTLEYYTGYYFLNINNNADGHNVYAGLRYKPGKKYTLYGQFDYLNRFNKTDGRLLGGFSSALTEKLNLSAELGLAPGARIFPIVSGYLELAYPVVSSTVLSAGLNLSHYRDADVYGMSVAGEYYPYGNLSVFLRVSISKTEFDGGKSSVNDAQMLKVTWFINDTDKIFTYLARGNEAFRIDTIDQTGDIKANIFGIGGTHFITPALGISPSFEFQDREKDTIYSQFGMEFKYLF